MILSWSVLPGQLACFTHYLFIASKEVHFEDSNLHTQMKCSKNRFSAHIAPPSGLQYSFFWADVAYVRVQSSNLIPASDSISFQPSSIQSNVYSQPVTRFVFSSSIFDAKKICTAVWFCSNLQGRKEAMQGLE